MSVITLEQFKKHARIDGTDEDAAAQTKVDAVNAYILGVIAIDPEVDDEWEPAPDLIQAALMIAAHFWENRETTSATALLDIPLNAAEVIQNYREWQF